MKVFVVTTVVKGIKESKQVTLGVFQDKEVAEQTAIQSLTTEGGVLCHLIARRKELGYDTEIVKLIEGSTTKWGIWSEGADWHTQTSFWIAASVEETVLK